MIHHPHDRAWLAEQLAKLPYHTRERIMREYSRVLVETYRSTEPELQKANAARRAANARLREFIKRWEDRQKRSNEYE